MLFLVFFRTLRAIPLSPIPREKMQKFSIFTVILASVMVVVVAEFAINGYGADDESSKTDLTFDLPEGLDLSQVTTTNILGSDDFGFVEDEVSVNSDLAELAREEFSSSSGIVYDEIPFSDQGPTDLLDFEDEDYQLPSADSIYLRADQVQSAGFADSRVVEELHDGLLFKSVYIDDLHDVEVQKWAVQNENQLFAKVYVFSFGPDSGMDSVYEILKVRTSQGLNAEVNETDDFGDGSFYMNDTRRQNTAFLTAKIGPLIYSFSYPKEYHQQIDNLVTLLDLEL